MSRRSLNRYLDSCPAFVRNLETRLHPLMSAIIANAAAIVAQLTVEERAPADRTLLIYNGIDPAGPGCDATTRERVRAALGASEDETVLCMVGNLIAYKGHRDLIEACSRLVDRPKWRLLVVGADQDGLEVGLREMCAASGLLSRVAFLGFRSDVPELLAASDIGVLASHEEGLPNAILEYMKAALPVVATDVGGVGELVVAGYTGLVVPPRSPERLADALRTLLEDRDLRGRLGQAGRERVVQEFSLTRTVRDYEAVYDAVAAGAPVATVLDRGRPLTQGKG